MGRLFLHIVAGPRQGEEIPIPPTGLVIGRRRGDLLLDDPLVSGAHCRIVFRDGAVLLEDLGSTNGTGLDGRPVKEAPLRPGSVITVGGHELVLRAVPAEPPRPAAVREPSADRPARPPGQEIAWLLEEELASARGGRADAGRSVGPELRLPPGLHAVVEVLAGPDAGKVFRLDRGSVTIGRRHGEVPLTDVEVSRHHALVEIFGRRMIFLRDLGSTNGTFHNGRRVHVAPLDDGDTVGCGQSVLKLQLSRGDRARA